jgi:hypothetical protein
MHYKLSVILTESEFADLDNSLEQKLKKFDENLDVDPYIVRTQEEIIDYYREYVRSSFESPGYISFKEALDSGTAQEDQIEYWNDLKEKLSWDDEDFYIWCVTHYLGEEDLDEDGNETSTYNPDSRWDWWQVGGRYSNAITTENGEQVNFAKIKDIRKGRDEEQYKKGLRLWDVLVNNEKFKDEKEEEELRDWFFYKKDYIKNRYLNKERFAEEFSMEFSTYAFLTKDGQWLEEENVYSMEYNGMTEDEIMNLRYQKGREFTDRVFDILNEQDENDYIVVVDCHI